MKRLWCRCGRKVYFENHLCGNCGRRLGFDPAALEMRSEQTPGTGLPFCDNRDSASSCNWLTDDGASGTCRSCRTSRIIPALDKPENRGRWRRLEAAKRRLLYDLLRLGMPVDTSRLEFVFKEDRRTNPLVHDEHVATGHHSGTITINAAEADAVFREAMREKMNEPYRTLLGHLRHESGHHYFDVVVGPDNLAEARALFGDENADYAAAVDRYYRDGPPAGWQDQFISRYAASHPAEDWAECWAHYLHIRAVLEAAADSQLIAEMHIDNWRAAFIDLVFALNDIMRSLGLPDAYPFVLTQCITEKIEFVHRAIEARNAG